METTVTTGLLPNSELLFSLLVESIVDAFILFVVAIVAIRLLKIEEASLRSRFMLLPLVVPVLLGAAFHWFVELIGPISPPKLAEYLLYDLATSLTWVEPAVVIVFGLAILLNGWQVLQEVATPFLLGWRWSRQIPAEDSIENRCQQLLDRLWTSETTLQRPRLIFSRIPGVHAVSSLGRWPCYIIVQPGLVQALDDEELEAVLAHEVAHLRQIHSPLNFVARLCRGLMWFNPAAYLAYRRFVDYQEEAADDGAVALTHNPLALASGMIKGLRFPQGQAPAVGIALWGRGQGLERRIHRLINYHPSTRTPRHSLSLLGLALASALLFAMLW